MDSAHSGIVGVVLYVPGPELAPDSDHDPGAQVPKLNPNQGPAKKRERERKINLFCFYVDSRQKLIPTNNKTKTKLFLFLCRFNRITMQWGET